MIFLFLSKIIAACILLVCLGFIGYWTMVRMQGDCRFVVMGNKRTLFQVVAMDLSTAECSCRVAIANTGKQAGTLMDVFCRTYLPREQYDQASAEGSVTAAAAPRDDHYWEACIVKSGEKKELLVTVRLKGQSGNLLRDLETFPDMDMDIIYQMVGRSDWRYEKSRITLTSEELRNALYQYTAGRRA